MWSDTVVQALRGYTIRPFLDEAGLQAALETVFEGAGLHVQREFKLGPRERLDFFLDGLAIEIKLKGSMPRLLEQLLRYARHDCVTELLVITPRARLLDVPREILSKPVRAYQLLGF